MYVHGKKPDAHYVDIFRNEQKRHCPVLMPFGQRPAPVEGGSLDRAEDFSVELLFKKLAPFIEKSDLKGALLLIRSYSDKLEDLSADIEMIETLVELSIGYNKLLESIDALVDQGKFDEATKLVEDNLGLIKSIGKDPENIKRSITDMKELMSLVEKMDFLIIHNSPEKAMKLVDDNKALLKRLDISPEKFKETFFPDNAAETAR